MGVFSLCVTSLRLELILDETEYHNICHHLIFFTVLNSKQQLQDFQALILKMHAELLRWQRQCVLLFDEVERLSQVTCHDEGMQRFNVQTWRIWFRRRTPARRFGNIFGFTAREKWRAKGII